MGLAPATPVDDWLRERPAAVAAVHLAFAAAGAEIVLAGTFRLLPHLQPAWAELADIAVALARRAAVETWASIGPASSASARWPPRGGTPWAALARHVAPRVDGFYLETFTDPAELDAALDAILPLGLPVTASIVPGPGGCALGGEALRPWVDRWAGRGAAVGLNCASSEVIGEAVTALADHRLWLKPSGSPVRLPAAALGGCCGVGPDALAAFHRGPG